MSDDAAYPEGAYAPGTETLWWELKTRPGTKMKFGQTAKLSAWLWFNKDVGDTFTMNELRTALGQDIVGSSEHLNRRFRKLREYQWVVPSGNDIGAGVSNSEYRLDKKGIRYWLDDERRSVETFAPSHKVRRLVLDRDGNRCVICGIGAGEAYPGEPDTRARLTIGHRVPQERLRQYKQKDNLDNWRTECSRCNETVRDAMPDPHTYEEVIPHVRALSRNEKVTLYHWLERGERVRSELDRVYDLARTLSLEERARLVDSLKGFAS
ncbi:HNH endonuclease [Cellulosimicrobium cellulans]|uniref:HNH endonuclease n=1 Tax=Cellulosimicrobium cellulans TaxID=1710 RepID=UPI000848C4ED|nr:HNH endonuclease signature motif containing protein [Cellulosimicrobium cellulans]